MLSEFKDNLEKIPKLWFSVDDTTSNYEFLLPVPNAFAVDTEEYYLRYYIINDVKAH